MEIGKGVVRRKGQKVAMLVFGVQLAEALKVAENLDATVVDMRFVKPLDEALVREMAASHELLVTIEENAIMGGAGARRQRVPRPREHPQVGAAPGPAGQLRRTRQARADAGGVWVGCSGYRGLDPQRLAL